MVQAEVLVILHTYHCRQMSTIRIALTLLKKSEYDIILAIEETFEKSGHSVHFSVCQGHFRPYTGAWLHR
jgi:hypothetical protein